MKRRWVAMALALLTAVPMQLYFGDAPVYAAAVQSGQCGENVFWKFEDGTLTIYGEGAMEDMVGWNYLDVSDPYPYTPWKDFRKEIQTAVVEGNVTTIGSSAFGSCVNLTELRVTAPLAEIKWLSFRYCTKLAAVTLPDLPIGISRGAFSDCTQMITETDGMRVFNGKYLLGYTGDSTELTVPDGITTLIENAFYDQTNLRQIHIPDSVRCVNTRVFNTGTPLWAQSTRDDGFTLIDGKLLVGSSSTMRVLHIPEGATVIANKLWYSNALLGNVDLYEVVFPDSLRTVGTEAFHNCRNLMRLELNDGLERIGTNALSGCTRLNSLTIPASVTEIGVQENCSLKDIYGVPGSEAERFALANGITFHDITESEGQSGISDFDYTANGWSFGNSREAFNNEFYLTAEDLAAVQAFTNNKYYQKDWNGACFGLSLTVILAKNGLFPLEKLQPGAQTLSEIEPTPQVQSFINYHHAIQFSSAYLQSAAAIAKENPVQRLGRLVIAAKNLKAGESPFLLEFAYSGGSHAVVVYGYESGEWTYNGYTYDGRILIWDPNVPDGLYDDSCLYYSSATFDHCIPFYNLQYSGSEPDRNSGNIIHFCNDPDVLNAYPYPFAYVSYGDVNTDGTVDISDAVVLARYLAENRSTQITESGLINADCDGRSGLDAGDVIHILRMIVRLV